MKLKPERGKTPEDYLSDEQKSEMPNANETLDSASYVESNYFIKCPNLKGYLAASRDGWLEIRIEKYKWKTYEKSGSLVLEGRNNPKKDYYVGRSDFGCAGVYYWWKSSDWLEFTEDGRLMNNDFKDTCLAKHTNGYLYWVTSTEARDGGYTVLYFKKENA
jgi:hypothetical protein